MKTILLTTLLLTHAIPALADEAELPAEMQAIIGRRTVECSAFENGVLSLDDGAVQRVDLNGDGEDDWVLDEFFFKCSSAASLFCGTGGCGVSFQIGDVLTSRLAKGWDTYAMPPLSLVLLQVHGSICGGTNVNPCVDALVWDSDELKFFSPAE
jgi:hypothetical protein